MIDHRNNRIQLMAEELRTFRNERDLSIGSQIHHDNSLVALQKVNDDYAAQVSLLQHSESDSVSLGEISRQEDCHV